VAARAGGIEVFRSAKDGQWYWRVKAANGRVVAASEGYKDKRGAQRGVKALGRALGLPGVNYEVLE
jgi:uncharacterized protein YegP (UPF0339 family)